MERAGYLRRVPDPHDRRSALALSDADGRGRVARVGLAGAIVGQFIIAAAEVIWPSNRELGDVLFGVSAILTGVGLVTAGVAIIRAGSLGPAVPVPAAHARPVHHPRADPGDDRLGRPASAAGALDHT